MSIKLPTLLKSRLAWLIIFYYLVLYEWWIKIFVGGSTEGTENSLYGLVYAGLALIGFGIGVWSSRKYGGFKSVLGRGILFLSLGLLSEALGQLTWSYYNFVLDVEAPYPSIADFWYFLIIPFYSLGMLSFAKASGASLSLKELRGKIVIVLIPVVALVTSYFIFLKDYAFDFTQPLTIFLDFAFPLGDGIYISLAVITYLLSKKYLGGLMKQKILLVIFAFAIQFLTNFSFLFTISRETYYNGSFVDLLFATSYALMSLVLLNFKYLVQENKS